jgi:hypothetical protein
MILKWDGEACSFLSLLYLWNSMPACARYQSLCWDADFKMFCVSEVHFLPLMADVVV